MKTLTISSDYELTLPQEMCERLKLQPGQKIDAVENNGQIILIPAKTAGELQGFLGEVDIAIDREPDRY